MPYYIHTNATDMKLRPHQQTALDAMLTASHGAVLVPTGGGKTLIAIMDLQRRLSASQRGLTAVIVCPRLLLVNQLCEEYLQVIDTKNVHIMHVHSGDTHYFSTTKPEKISLFNNTARVAGESCLIFTTYHSLNRIVEAGIEIDVAYFDEAHNATSKQFFPKTAMVSQMTNNCYFFTATPRQSKNPMGRGMNNSLVFGKTLHTVPAQDLINSGSIIPPQIVIHEQPTVARTKSNAANCDSNTVLEIIDNLDENAGQKILVAAPSSKIIWGMVAQTAILQDLAERGYDVMHITSKYGAYINKTKVNREVFFNTLTAWGKDSNRKFVVFHYSILSEGMNVPGLTHCVLLRNLNIVEMAQTIGRVIRMNADDARDIAEGKLNAGDLGSYRKPFGFVTVPIYGNYGVQIQKRLQTVVDAIFVKGVPPTSIIA
jgi:superfamily II DNA or RNA helicase